MHLGSYYHMKETMQSLNYKRLAIVYCITKFHQYIYSKRVQILSYHRPLEHLNSLVKHSSRLARYSLILQNYDIECKYVRGCEQMADALTRMYE